MDKFYAKSIWWKRVFQQSVIDFSHKFGFRTRNDASSMVTYRILIFCCIFPQLKIQIQWSFYQNRKRRMFCTCFIHPVLFIFRRTAEDLTKNNNSAHLFVEKKINHHFVMLLLQIVCRTTETKRWEENKYDRCAVLVPINNSFA